MKKTGAALAPVFILVIIIGLLTAEEGMFTPDRIKDLNLKEKGMKISPEKVFNPGKEGLQETILLMGGGTSEFVSPDGLILTNHHVAYGAVAGIASEEKNYLEDGFLAKSYKDEIPVEDIDARILRHYENVTKKILDGVDDDDTLKERKEKIKKNTEKVVDDAKKKDKSLEYSIKPFYDGNQYYLEGYFVIRDLRVVFVPPLDIGFFGGDIDNWIKVANTIRFRMYLNMENAAGMTQLINDTGVGMISSNADDFQFQFGTGIAPQNRHPMHQWEYTGGNKYHYMDNYFMYNMLMKDDPRIKYYLYRQDDGSSLTFETIPCNTRTDCIYGYLGTNPDLAGHPDAPGYIGRDHGDPSGIPGDNDVRTTFGIYPIGGRYDDGSFSDMDDEEGTGEGIIPYLTFSMVKFMHAESVLRYGLAGDASVLMREGIVASMEKVSDFATTLDQDAPPIDDADIAAYADSRVLDFALAATPAAELNVVMKEKYYAIWGNGIEAYTDYRRTGCPLDLPPSLAPAAPYPLRLHYSVNEQASNPNTPEPSITDPIFWDKD